MKTPTEYRLQQVQRALWGGATIDQVFDASRIDPWFLRQIQVINEQAALIAQPGELNASVLKSAKASGFSDSQIALLRGITEDEVRRVRHHLSIRPVYKTVDTCAAEFEAFTPYHYSSYEEESEVRTRSTPAVFILGSGPNRIGQGIEFD
jgi:carbamoyl-phosphate synthase large subunit